MNVDSVREDFPILKDLIYLDSASTSLTPEPVLKAVLDYYHQYRANVGRGVYRSAMLAEQRYREAHRKIGELIGAKVGTVVFTRNATESINMVAGGLPWRKGDKVVATLVEHHSNLLPWMRLRERGVDLRLVVPDRQGMLCLADFEEAIEEGTRLVAVSQVSNVLGTVLPVAEISQICKERGAQLLVDGAQSVPHMPVKVEDLDCDFLCFSGHKMLGPTGTGALWIREEEEIEPLLVGGGMVEEVTLSGYRRKRSFEGLEAGSPDVGGGIGLGAAADYLRSLGMEEILAHEARLTKKLLQGLQEIEGVFIYGPLDLEDRGGVVSFNIEGQNPHHVALILDQAAGIAVRSGHHCCMPLMKHLGLPEGTVRASLYLYNTEEEVEEFLQKTETIARVARF
jgi:cysteine desulfurase/selenocysteine lyase